MTALLLLAMSAGQLSDFTGFVGVIEAYELGGRAGAWVLACALLFGEVSGGGALLVGVSAVRFWGATAAVVVALAWSVLAVQAFARGLDLDNCGCFGTHLAQPLRWWVLVEDAQLVVLSSWVRRSVARPLGPLAVSTHGGVEASSVQAAATVH